MVVFPPPEFPTIATVSPTRADKFIFFNTGVSLTYSKHTFSKETPSLTCEISTEFSLSLISGSISKSSRVLQSETKIV